MGEFVPDADDDRQRFLRVVVLVGVLVVGRAEDEVPVDDPGRDEVLDVEPFDHVEVEDVARQAEQDARETRQVLARWGVFVR
ncbi:hypothetical protein GCM10022243_30960 [Saccharothrix violaceirubra]|uniref:Uncharacterized protein n=1 Tax=Saccharothrix violaceirubra TaxID=413306 RepID=A0A7W7WX35_9PSEU|nr:hypothetical protein [Saccharothrix violaceirubra]MBB4966721.1 hypothetical protein [Saccharothrix violaceirubra]